MVNKIVKLACIYFMLTACNEQKIYVPQSNTTIIKEITDFTNVSFLYKEEKEFVPAIQVQNKALITQTNWIFEIDKRLPLKLVIPEITKLQEKKLKNTETIGLDNYYTYMDTLAKNVAFMPFTNVSYHKNNQNVQQNAAAIDVKVNREGVISINNKTLNMSNLNTYLSSEFLNKQLTVYLIFDENLVFEKYLQIKLELSKNKSENIRISTIEVVY